MKINPISSPYTVNRYKETSHKSSIPAKAAKQVDNVELSASAKSFAAALEAAKKTDEVRTDYVSELKSRIDSGTYKPDSHAIAEKMIASVFRG